MKQKEANKLILKYIEKRISEEESDLLTKWIESDENTVLFKEYVELHSLLNAKHRFDHHPSWQKFGSSLQHRKRVRRIRIFRYAAACIFLLCLTLVVLYDSSPNEKQEETTTKMVLQDIRPGTNKALLQLGNGDEIVLGKGNTFIDSIHYSTDESLVYSTNTGKLRENNFNILTIPRGGQFRVELADGTVVWLNSDSQLRYPVFFHPGQTRQVELVYGEAYFDVSPGTEHQGDAFKLISPGQEIEVLGTEFNVRAYKNEKNIYTTLSEGKIKITGEGSQQLLLPGQQAVMSLDDGKISVNQANVYREICWKDGIFSFDNTPLKDIMKVLSRWYDVDVVFKNKDLENLTFNGGLKKKQNLLDILEIISEMNNINYEINENTVILK
ncbi:FecR family protein [Sinomicrobium soli]|uniref:FecR family protein n=1 Tax=Sinomicrobium sp. N-1-3-6 TaxID=2219864 RepID=UPI001374A452|nr:FecR domain-containing protein [Sinomicrobium sp. N-1-3-6]